MKLSNLKIVINSKGFFPALTLVLVDFMLIAGMIYGGFYLFTLYGELTDARLKYEETRQTATLVSNNKKLLEAKVMSFNTALDGLIPDQESYFQIISAFERLSQKTGLAISNYTINLDDTTAEKITFSLNIVGTPEQIKNFLNIYPYAGRRLLVSDRILYNQSDESSLTIELSFFNGRYIEDSVSSTDVPVVSQEDISNIEDILSKLN